MNDNVVEKNINRLKDTFEKYKNIVGVIVFGSYNTIYYNDKSDIDFGIIYSNVPSFYEELEIEDKISEIIGSDKIDVVSLNKAPIIIKYNAIANGKIIYENNYEETCDFLENVYRVYCDYEHDYKTFCKDYDNSLKEKYVNG